MTSEAGTGASGSRPEWRRWLLAVPALTLAAGLLVGFAVGDRRTVGDQPRVTATAPPASRAKAPTTSIVVRTTASSACLETARRGDQIIDLLIQNRRARAADLLVPYTVASRQCRRDASP